ncbi:MAG: DUF4345 domain-containing protein [Halioglobus sp.]
MSFQSFVVFLVAAFFLVYGLAFVVYPEGMALLVTQNKPEGVSALIDFRSTYGGMTAAVGGTLLYLHAINQIRPALVIVIIVLIGMAVARTYGLIVDGAGNLMMYLYLALEITGSALAYFSLNKHSKDD